MLIVLRQCAMLYLSTADSARLNLKEVNLWSQDICKKKNGIYYVVLTYKTYDGKRKTKWQSTGLPTKGNKKASRSDDA